MSLHNVGDMVATYIDASMTNSKIGWINELVDEIIWFGEIDSRQLRYRVEWSDGEEDVFPLYSDEDIQLMKNLYESKYKTKT